MKPIRVYVPNLPHRKDRRISILAQYENRPEFELHMLTPVPHEVPPHSLWKTFEKAVRLEVEAQSDYFIFSEDDHVFTENYSCELLQECIAEADRMGADTLSGGVGWYSEPLQVSEHLFWVDKFNGTQFVVVFRRFYPKILELSENGNAYTLDWKISEVSDRTFCSFPVISIQKEFGYSDMTTRNAEKGFLTNAFTGVSIRMEMLNKVYDYFSRENTFTQQQDIDTGDLQIPIYIVQSPECTGQKENCLREFASRNEFDSHLFPATQKRPDYEAQWQSIKQIIRTATNNGDDVVAICTDGHSFTTDYHKEVFLNNVIAAGRQGCQLLFGGFENYKDAVHVSSRRWWVDWARGSQFMIIYRCAFPKILNAQFNTHDTFDVLLSNLLTHKQVLWPFISIRKDSKNSGVTPGNNTKDIITQHLETTRKRMERLDEINRQLRKPKSNYTE